MKQSSFRLMELLEDRRLMSAGDLDLSFGNGGKVQSAALGFNPSDIALQSDGKIIAVGERDNHFAVARLNANGSLDTTFGDGDGIATANFGGNRGDAAFAVAIQADGKIVVAGVKRNASAIAFGEQNKMAIARFNTNGRRDLSFDGDGQATVDIGWGDSEARDVAIQSDGKIVLGGTYFAGNPWSSNDLALARLNTNGSHDLTFGEVIPTTTMRMGFVTTGLGKHERGFALALAPDGKIVLGGESSADEWSGGGATSRFAVARYKTDGTPDNSFAHDGKTLVTFSGGARVNALAFQNDGKLILAGTSNYQLALARLGTNGFLDGSFGTGGTGTLVSSVASGASSVVVTREGILTAGKSNGDFALSRFNFSGGLDNNFGSNGKVSTDFGGDESALLLKLNPDGRIFAAGKSASGNVVAARYLNSSPKVSVSSLDRTTSEGGFNDRASFIFVRDQRLSYPTRVYYSMSGTATNVGDYTTMVGFIDIPAGETFVVQELRAVNDSVLESTETAQLSIAPSKFGLYNLGSRTSETISITDNDHVYVNFQPAGTPTVNGYATDAGDVYSYHGSGLTYGWDADNRANARDRNDPSSPDQRFDTLNHMQKDGADRKWEMAVNNGWYAVRITMGDPSNLDSVYKVNVENVLAVNGTPDAEHYWLAGYVHVYVNDGRLTISNAPGAVNNRICFVQIEASAPPPGAQSPAQKRSIAGSARSLFSERRIDEPLLSI
jgi:uncharacterized delta-60 repeat protein